MLTAGTSFFQVGESVLVRRDKLFNRETRRKYFNLYVGPFQVVEVLNDNAYKVHITRLLASRPSVDRTFNVTSLKPFNPRSNDFETVPPTSIEEICNKLDQIEEIEEASDEQVTLKWKNSSFSIPLTRAQYLKIMPTFRHVLEKSFKRKYPDAPVFHIPRTTQEATDPLENTSFPSVART